MREGRPEESDVPRRRKSVRVCVWTEGTHVKCPWLKQRVGNQLAGRRVWLYTIWNILYWKQMK